MKLLIKKHCLLKLNYINSQISNTEWMGYLFYKINGDLNTQLELEAIDILPIAKGEPSEVGMSNESIKKVMMYTLDNELEDCGRAILHSHHNMNTSFSHTDTTQLLEWSKGKPYFLSVVVNNKLEFTAKICIEITIKGSFTREIKSLIGLNRVFKDKEEEFTKTDYKYIELEVFKEESAYISELNILLGQLETYAYPHRQIANQWQNGEVGHTFNRNRQFQNLPLPNTNKTKDKLDKELELEFTDIKRQAIKEYSIGVNKKLLPAAELAENIVFDTLGTGITIGEAINILENESMFQKEYTFAVIRNLKPYLQHEYTES